MKVIFSATLTRLRKQDKLRGFKCCTKRCLQALNDDAEYQIVKRRLVFKTLNDEQKHAIVAADLMQCQDVDGVVKTKNLR